MADLDPIKQEVQINIKEKGVTEATKGYDNLQTSITETTTATAKGNDEFKKTEEGFKSLKVQLKEAVVLQQKLSAQYGSTSKEAIKAADSVALIKDEIEFQKQLVESYNPDDKFRKLTQTAGVAALALGGVKDGFTALGIESKTLDKIIGSAQAILGVTSAVAGMSDAYQVLTAAKRAKSAADVVEAGTTEALVLAEGQATAATWSWNAALLANPIVLIAAGIVAAGAAIYAFTKIMSDSVKEEEKAKVASLQLTTEIDNQAKAFENNNKFAKAGNDHKIELLRASGASEAQIYKETKALKDQERQLALNYEKEAELLERKAFFFAKNQAENGTKDSAKLASDAYELAKKNLEKAIELRRGANDSLIDLQNAHEVAVVQAATDARKKAEEKQKAAEDKVLQDKKDANAKLLEEQKKFNADVLKEQQNMNVQRVNLEIQEKLDATEQKEQDITEAFAAGDRAQEDLDKQKQRDVDSDKAALEAKKENQNTLISQGEQLIANVARLAGKNKAIQKAAIVTEGAVSLGKVGVNIATGVSKDAASGAVASVPQIAKTVATGAFSAASIISNTNKALKALGGGGGASGDGASPSLPTRNVAQVGFQGSSENQIGTAFAKSQKEQPPIEAFVVSQAVANQQEYDRKKELLNSF